MLDTLVCGKCTRNKSLFGFKYCEDHLIRYFGNACVVRDCDEMSSSISLCHAHNSYVRTLHERDNSNFSDSTWVETAILLERNSKDPEPVMMPKKKQQASLTATGWTEEAVSVLLDKCNCKLPLGPDDPLALIAAIQRSQGEAERKAAEAARAKCFADAVQIEEIENARKLLETANFKIVALGDGTPEEKAKIELEAAAMLSNFQATLSRYLPQQTAKSTHGQRCSQVTLACESCGFKISVFAHRVSTGGNPGSKWVIDFSAGLEDWSIDERGDQVLCPSCAEKEEAMAEIGHWRSHDD